MSVSSIYQVIIRAACTTVLLLAGSAALAAAQPKSPAADATSAASASGSIAANQTEISLATLGNLSGPLRLAGAAVARSMSIPLSAREQARDAVLHLVVSNSVSLLMARSQLAVRINDRTVAQLQLSPRQPETTADIRVPVDLLRPGYNALTFAVAEHSTENCEDPNSPELWMEIDTTASTLRMQTELKPLTPTLANLSDLVDPKQWSARSIAIVNAARPDNDQQLASGGLLAQGIALRLRYLSATPRVLDAQPGTGAGMLSGLALTPLAGSDVLLIGARDALRRYIDPQIAARIDGAFLGVYPKPDDARHFVLVVSGRDDAEVNRAARAFAHSELPLPRSSELVVGEFDESTLPRWSASRTISGTAPWSFRQLGFTSRTLRPQDEVNLDVRLPADIYAPEDAKVTLDMNFSEGARMREDSVLDVRLNGRFAQAIALDQTQGAVIRHYRISLPLRDFHTGQNTLSLRALLVPSVSDRCVFRQTDNLEVTLLDSSTLTLPDASHYATLPDLKRFADGGFPYTVPHDGSGLAVRIASKDHSTIAAAWSLMSKLAQSQMAPLTSAQVTFGAPGAGRHTVLVGATPALPLALLDHAPWSPGKSISVMNSMGGSSDERSGSWFNRHWDALFDAPVHAAPIGDTLRGDLTLSQQLLVMQYRDAAGRALTVLTSASADELLDGVSRLVEPTYWGGLDGNVAVLSFNHPGLWTAQIGDTYETGTLGAMEWLGFSLSRHPWLGYAALVLLLAVFAASTSLLLKRYHQKQHRDADQ
ncbi:cellulose synthase subunit [Paraburkholderia steynii]|uniref:Cyclic di-GMP-binding protein n=1 Tax=Paraburkholderia steynii TaxID=1245441 RepID=A0A7Z7BCA9_9BURK|nr:cellulose biosynthesis cyclic di-GMP-binding regulatory protein BcsB [Paraburkholderia steynii]SDI70285.1 cellulose synthase subunit [Paraburkholderia steynii]